MTTGPIKTNVIADFRDIGLKNAGPVLLDIQEEWDDEGVTVSNLCTCDNCGKEVPGDEGTIVDDRVDDDPYNLQFLCFECKPPPDPDWEMEQRRAAKWEDKEWTNEVQDND